MDRDVCVWYSGVMDNIGVFIGCEGFFWGV